MLRRALMDGLMARMGLFSHQPMATSKTAWKSIRTDRTVR
nr:MAG TPA: hypothetical protein [Caudoviricetes sp.]